MVEQANLLTSSIVDWLGDGREAGDKRKVEKERFIWLSPLPCTTSPRRRTIAAGLSWPLLFSISLHSITPPVSWRLLSPRSHWSPASGSFCVCNNAVDFAVTRYLQWVQQRGTRPCQYIAILLGCGWEIEGFLMYKRAHDFLFSIWWYSLFCDDIFEAAEDDAACVCVKTASVTSYRILC